MEKERKPRNYWTYELAKEVASGYTSRNEFYIGSRGCYGFCKKTNILNEVCQHMFDRRWNFESAKLEASKYNSRTNFYNNKCGYIYIFIEIHLITLTRIIS